MMVNNVHKRWQAFACLDVCLQAVEACASLDQMFDEISAAADEQSLNSLLTLSTALSSHVATVSETIERIERAK